MPKVRIHIRLSTENYDFLCEVSRRRYDIGVNKALNQLLDEARANGSESGPGGPQRPTSGLKVDSRKPKP